jgi:hypothetical protein
MLISLTVETSGRGSHALELLTAHKIITFRCKYLATMAMGDDDDEDVNGGGDDDDDGNGGTGDEIQRRWRWTTMTMRLMVTARRATMMATLVIIIYSQINYSANLFTV